MDWHKVTAEPIYTFDFQFYLIPCMPLLWRILRAFRTRWEPNFGTLKSLVSRIHTVPRSNRWTVSQPLGGRCYR